MKKAIMVLCVVIGLGSIASIALGDINATGDVWPGDSAMWTPSATVYIGETGAGGLTVDGDSSMLSDYSFLGYQSGVTGVATVSGVNSTWINSSHFYIGSYGRGALNVTNGGAVTSTSCGIGYHSESTGTVTVSGSGSTWINSSHFYVGVSGDGDLDIVDGGIVSNTFGNIGRFYGATGVVTVSGSGSTWTNSDWLYVGRYGGGALNIYDGGLVCSAIGLTIDDNGDGDSFINMGAGGMLALFGDADDSLSELFELVDGTDAIRYWDDSLRGWANITGAAADVDYTLSYRTEGDLAGYTVLTVTTPVPTPGDTNGDYIVDVLDFKNLIAQLGGAPGAESADFNGDNFVDLEDFAIQRGNIGFGVTASAPEFQMTIPEPATLTALTLGGLALVRRRKHRACK
jgi:T5SS/PEP-CTERM-associated repeat protein